MSDPYHYQSHLHQYANSNFWANPDPREHRVAPTANIIVPGLDGQSAFKRPRDHSPSDNSWQKSFKRLKVMEDAEVSRLVSKDGGSLNAVSVDEASVPEENFAGRSQDGLYPQYAGHFPQQGHGQQKHDMTEYGREEHLQSTGHVRDSAQNSDQPQVPGQGSSEVSPVDYQPMNSLLGSLHRSRRRQLSGAGQSTDTSSHEHQQHPGVTQQSQYLHSHRQQQPSSLNHQPTVQSHQSGTGGSTLYFRPAKKKNISLRVDSNLY